MPTPLHWLALLGTMLAVAVVWDLDSRRVPNGLIVLIAATGLTWQLLAGGVRGVASGLVAGLVVGMLAWGAWSQGRIGGADLKVAVAVALGVGLERLPLFVLVTALAGGVLSLACYLASARKARAEIRSNVVQVALFGQLPQPTTDSPGRVSVPYVGAVALGALATLGFGG